MKTIRCVLKKGKERPLEGRHPWVFSGAIDRIDDDFETGSLVKVYSSQDKFLGIGYLNPRSQISIRILTFEDIKIDEGFFAKRIQQAIAYRNRYLPPQTNAYRLIHSEADGLPGLIGDCYGDYLVLQFSTAGIEKWRDAIVSILEKEFPVAGIFAKDDTEARDWEGLPKRVGKLSGQEPPDYVEIMEYGHPFVVDIHRGQKTGFFLDQRENRNLVQRYAAGRRVLNCFSYTGAFSVYAAKGKASGVVSVDSSEQAMNTAKINFERNQLSGDAFEFVKEDVFQYLRDTRQEFDMIILDPPAFCRSKQQIQQAARGYKDINLSALKMLNPGGLLFTFSCSSHINPDLFQKIIFGAAKDARKTLRILAKTSHAYDHPINIFHPEGEYLKGLICEVA